MPKRPVDAIRESGQINMPMIIGYNDKEGIIMLLDAYKKLELLEKDFQRMIPRFDWIC